MTTFEMLIYATAINEKLRKIERLQEEMKETIELMFKGVSKEMKKIVDPTNEVSNK